MNEVTAEGFMKSLPPKGWDDLATKSDLEMLHAATKSDIAALETKIDTRIEALETKIDTMGTVLTATFTAALATEMGKVHQEFAAVHKELGAARGGQRGQMVTLIVMIFVAMVGQTTVSRYFPPPPPQIIIESPSE